MEPWMSGTLTFLGPIRAALLYSFQHAQEDLERWTRSLTDEDIWRRFGDVAPVGFHIRHIAGSVDRLITYAQGGTLDDAQMKVLKSEAEATGPSRDGLLALLNEKLSHADAIVRSIDPKTLEDVREIGRKRVPVPLGVLLVHIAEHTQRHVGAAIVTAKMAGSASNALRGSVDRE
jgi:hypothetical protein